MTFSLSTQRKTFSSPAAVFVGWVCFSWNPSSLGSLNPNTSFHTQPENRLDRTFSARKPPGWSEPSPEGCRLGRQPPTSFCNRGRRARQTRPGAQGARAGGRAGGCRARRATARAAGSQPGPRGSDDCAVPRATKFESAGRDRLRPAPLGAAPGSSAQVSCGLGAPSAAREPPWGSETVRAGAWPRGRVCGGPARAGRAGRQGAAGAAGRELGDAVGGPGCAPVVADLPRDLKQPGLQAGSFRRRLRGEGCREGAFRGLRPGPVLRPSSPAERRGPAAPGPPLPAPRSRPPPVLPGEACSSSSQSPVRSQEGSYSNFTPSFLCLALQ